ncbi:hypothetical protein TeGR_g2684 [Tetraparma gracilis]|uniref:Uncharacterized protein n=1 Tax=Tetraparma gracilis TaxID=2962635 RepID=A0ABQ6N2X6_9STRA|nr:hypothetical protein TeGR_g2684 [Tetraparma gracilis]
MVDCWNETRTAFAVAVAGRVFFYSSAAGKKPFSLLCVAQHSPGEIHPEVYHLIFICDVLFLSTADTVQMVVPHPGTADVFVLASCRTPGDGEYSVSAFASPAADFPRRLLKFPYPTLLELRGAALVLFDAREGTTETLEIDAFVLRAALLFRAGQAELAEGVVRSGRGEGDDPELDAFLQRCRSKLEPVS